MIDSSLVGKRLLELEGVETPDTRYIENIKWSSGAMLGGGLDTVCLTTHDFTSGY